MEASNLNNVIFYNKANIRNREFTSSVISNVSKSIERRKITGMKFDKNGKLNITYYEPEDAPLFSPDTDRVPKRKKVKDK